MVPDKVYVKKEKNNVVYSLSVQYDNGGEEYIRKNTLMEKIDEILNAKPDGGLAIDTAAQAFIDIKKVINSM